MWASVDDLSNPFDIRGEEAIAAASNVLWSLSGRKYSGMHNIIEYYDVRPGFELDTSVVYSNAVFPYEPDTTACTNCGYPHRLRMRNRPVRQLLSVEINGVALDPATYVLLDHAILGLPLNLATCTATCVRVSYRYGQNPPAGGKAAAVALAEQLLLAWSNDDECRLPARVTNISRQGVSWTILDPQDFLNDGRTGIYTIDLFLKSVNPDNARRPARVFSPDIPRAQLLQDSTTTLPVVAVTEGDLGLTAPGEPGWYVVTADDWPGAGYTPYAVIDGTTYGSTYFTENQDGSWTLSLSGTVTYGLMEGDSFSVRAHPAVGADVIVGSGAVRFVRGG